MQTVKIIGPDGSQLGTHSILDALKIASSQELDLVEVSPNTSPVVCKLLDYGKLQFEEKKKEKAQKKAQKSSTPEVKEIQINSVIHDGDLDIKIKNIIRQLNNGDKVKVMVKFIGRHINKKELGAAIFEKILTALPNAVVEKQPSSTPDMKNMVMVLAPGKITNVLA